MNLGIRCTGNAPGGFKMPYSESAGLFGFGDAVCGESFWDGYRRAAWFGRDRLPKQAGVSSLTYSKWKFARARRCKSDG